MGSLIGDALSAKGGIFFRPGAREIDIYRVAKGNKVIRLGSIPMVPNSREKASGLTRPSAWPQSNQTEVNLS
jgi:hypothetical protein